MNSEVRELKQTKYWEHVDRPLDAPRDVRTVELLNVASNNELGEVAVYRPLDTNMPVYLEGCWDFKPLKEFKQRYQPVTTVAEIKTCDTIIAEIYPV